jgi:hypothetical protein
MAQLNSLCRIETSKIADMLAERLHLPLTTTINILNNRTDYSVAHLLYAE